MDGYVHVDVVAQSGVDVVDDGRTLETFDSNVADEIYSHWFIEHVAKHEVAPMLRQWRRVLRPRGRLRIVTNNVEAHNRCLHSGEISWEEWEYLLFAVQNKVGYGIWDIHKTAWNAERLSATLEGSGFVEVKVTAQWGCRERDGRLKCPALVAEALKG
ncbi:MAG: class I SAM-dependent methyltransferase [Solirubrobacteraceae bacterium]